MQSAHRILWWHHAAKKKKKKNSRYNANNEYIVNMLWKNNQGNDDETQWQP